MTAKKSYCIEIKARINKEVTPDLMDIIIHTLPPIYRKVSRKDLLVLASGDTVKLSIPNKDIAEKITLDLVKIGHKIDVNPIYKRENNE